MSSLLADLLAERDYLLADGATGTNMMKMGLPAGQPPDLWNTDLPENVTRLHESFIDAGADIILTNTFGANACRLKLDNAESRASELNEAGARVARSAADKAGRPVVVAGSMGPSGELLKPMGPLTRDEAHAVYCEQANALAEGGVDVLWIETIFAFDELAAAITAAAKTGLPVASTMTFDTVGRTMMGDTPEQAVEFISSLDVELTAFGANCGAGPAMLIDTICGFRRAIDTRGAEYAAEYAAKGAAKITANDAVIIAKGNCGVPELVDGEIRYSGDADTMARYARMARDAGARIIGGCCGTTADHLRAIGESLVGYEPGSMPERDAIEACLGPIRAPNPDAPSPHAPAPARRKRGRRGSAAE